jgi:hypothetical protein
MLVTLALTFGAVAAVLGLVGYRLSTVAGTAAPINADVAIPRGAKIVHTAVAEGRVVVTLDIAGATEIRLYDLRTLKPAGRLSFTSAP